MEEDLYQKFKGFFDETDTLKYESIWERNSFAFREFWKNKLLNANASPLTDSEIDEIILFLDKNAKGSTKDTIAVAKAMIPQGVWRRLFKEIQEDTELKQLLYSILTEKEENKQIELINKLYKFNKGKKNSLTGNSGNALNSMLFVFNPNKYLSMISLNDRKRVIEYFKLDSKVDFENGSPGEKIVLSNKAILDGFKKMNIIQHPYIMCLFLYKRLKNEWKPSDVTSSEIDEESIDGEYSDLKSSFSIERELENFLIANWDKTQLAKKYELIEEEGEMVSQQYKTDIGRIDILVKDKKTDQLVVIELKKDQTSDSTIGQILRYMAWLEDHKTNGKTTKGIIIASTYDDKLHYALKKVKGVEIFSYEVDFKLKEFKKA